LKEFVPTSDGVADAEVARNQCETFCWTSASCWGCSVHCGSPCQWNAIPSCGTEKTWSGKIAGDITQKIQAAE
jgi:hypothetical protein